MLRSQLKTSLQNLQNQRRTKWHCTKKNRDLFQKPTSISLRTYWKKQNQKKKDKANATGLQKPRDLQRRKKRKKRREWRKSEAIKICKRGQKTNGTLYREKSLQNSNSTISSKLPKEERSEHRTYKNQHLQEPALISLRNLSNKNQNKKIKIKIRKETKNEEKLKPRNPNAIFEIQPISSQPPEKNEERKWTWTSKGRQETARNTFTGEQTVPVPWRTMTEKKKKRGWEIAFRDRVERVELAALQRKRRRSSRDRGQGSRPWFLSTGRTYIDRVTERRGRGERNKGVGTRGCRRNGRGLHIPSTGRKSDLGSLRHFLWTLSLFFSPGFSVPFSSSYSSFFPFLFFFFGGNAKELINFSPSFFLAPHPGTNPP